MLYFVARGIVLVSSVVVAVVVVVGVVVVCLSTLGRVAFGSRARTHLPLAPLVCGAAVASAGYMLAHTCPDASFTKLRPGSKVWYLRLNIRARVPRCAFGSDPGLGNTSVTFDPRIFTVLLSTLTTLTCSAGAVKHSALRLPLSVTPAHC
jgi:hypothetical protein